MSDKRATRELERDLRRQPDNLPLRLRLAAAYRVDGRTAEAVQLYRSVAVAYHGQRRLAQAIAVCKSVLEIEPGQRETVALLAELEAMRPDGEPPPMPVGDEPAPAAPPGRPVNYTPASGMHALDGSGEQAPSLPRVTDPRGAAASAAPVAPISPSSNATPRAGVRVLDQEVAVRDLSPVRRPQVRPLMVPQSPPPAPAPLPRPSTANMTPTPLPQPMPYHEVADDSMSEITAPPTTIRAPARDTAPTGGDWTPRRHEPDADAETRIALPRGLDDDAPTRIADDWKAAPPGPPAHPLAARASSTQIDVSAELETRRRPLIDPHELELLGAAPPVTEKVERVDDTHDEESPPPDAGDSGDTGDSGESTHENPWPDEATDTHHRMPRDTQRVGSTVTDQGPPAPAAIGDAGDVGDVDATQDEVGSDGLAAGASLRGGLAIDATSDEATTNVGDVEPSALFEHSFVETISHLAPDGASLEGPGAGLLSVFTLLPDHARADLERTMIVRHVGPGEVILREGDRGDSCFVIGQGEVRVLKSDPLGRAEGGTGEPIEVARLGEGSLFGEFALLADRRRHATVAAVSACELYEVPRKALRELAATYPEVGPALERFFRERLLATLLATAPFFQPLPEDLRASLLARFVPMRADSGHTIVREGERSGGLYLIVLGAVEIVKRAADGRTTLLTTLREGAYVGEMSLLRGQAASASVLAAGPVELAFLPPRDFYEIVAGNPALWDAMRREASARALENARILAGDTSAV